MSEKGKKVHLQEAREYFLVKNSPCLLNGKVKRGKARPERSPIIIHLGRRNTALHRRWRKYSAKEGCICASTMMKISQSRSQAAKAMDIILQKVIKKRILHCPPPQRSSKSLKKWNSVCVSANRHRSVSLWKTSTKLLDVLFFFFVCKSFFNMFCVWLLRAIS